MNKLFWYGLQSRPLDFNTVPSNFAEFHQFFKDKDKRVRYGKIAYTERLSDADVSKYELVDLNEVEND